MHPALESIYYRAPVGLQNLAVTLYGLKLYRERYGLSASRHLRSLEGTVSLSPQAMREFLDDRVREMVGHALRTVPFWKNWARQVGAEPGDFRSVADLTRLPVINKNALRRAPQDFLSTCHADRKGLIHLSTSGTTGAPLTVVCDRDVRTRHYAFFSRLRRWFGLAARSRRATLFGRIILSPDTKKPPFWRYDAVQCNLLMSSYHLADQNLHHYSEALRRFGPSEVIGYPSSVYRIARHVVDGNEPRLTPKLVITTAETLLDYQRTVIEQAFACPVVDQYGCTEMAFFAAQCEAGTMHVHPEHGWIEALDDSGRPVEAGIAGRCTATGLVNPVMPLLRYEIGDMIVLGKNHCDCGRAFPVIERVEGRMDDVLETPDGRPLGRMDPIFKGCSGVVECQIVQTEPHVLEFHIVADSTYDIAAERHLLTEIRKRAGDSMQIRIMRVDSIARGNNGKFQSVVRRV